MRDSVGCLWRPLFSCTFRLGLFDFDFFRLSLFRFFPYFGIFQLLNFEEFFRALDFNFWIFAIFQLGHIDLDFWFFRIPFLDCFTDLRILNYFSHLSPFAECVTVVHTFWAPSSGRLRRPDCGPAPSARGLRPLSSYIHFFDFHFFISIFFYFFDFIFYFFFTYY